MDVQLKKEARKGFLSDSEVKDFIKKSQEGDQHARDILVEKNVRLVWSVVQRF